MFRDIGRLVITGTVTAGYAYVIYSVFEHITNIPIVYPAMLINILAQASASFLRDSYFVFYWLLFSILVFQLVSFHEDDICIRNTCHVTSVQKYIALACTGVAALQPKPTKPKKPRKVSEPATKSVELPLAPAVPLEPAGDNIKLVFDPNPRNLKWV